MFSFLGLGRTFPDPHDLGSFLWPTFFGLGQMCLLIGFPASLFCSTDEEPVARAEGVPTKNHRSQRKDAEKACEPQTKPLQHDPAQRVGVAAEVATTETGSTCDFCWSRQRWIHEPSEDPQEAHLSRRAPSFVAASERVSVVVKPMQTCSDHATVDEDGSKGKARGVLRVHEPLTGTAMTPRRTCSSSAARLVSWAAVIGGAAEQGVTRTAPAPRATSRGARSRWASRQAGTKCVERREPVNQRHRTRRPSGPRYRCSNESVRTQVAYEARA